MTKLRNRCFSTLLALACASPLLAAEHFDTCAQLAGASNGMNGVTGAWELPPDRQWYDLIENSYTVHTASDLIINGEIRLKVGSTPDTTIVLRVKVEGARGTSITTQPAVRRKVPDRLPQSLDVQWPVPDLPADDYTFTLQARSLGSGSDKVYMKLMWLAPHLVDAEESTFVNASNLTTPVAVGDTWTTLKSLLVDVPADRMLHLGAGLRLRSGTPGEKVEYRILDGAQQVGFWFDSVPAIKPDNRQLTRYHTDPQPGVRTLLLQAKMGDFGASATFTQVYFFGQTMPRYDVLEAASATPGNVPNDGQFYTVLETPYQTISPISLGDPTNPANNHRAYLGGYAFMGMPPDADPKSVHWRLKRVERRNGIETVAPWEAGSHVGHTSDRITLHSDLAAGCGNCGWRTDTEYKIELWARGQCPNTPGNISYARPDMQMLVVPSRYFFPDDQCGQLSFADCCNLPNNGCQWTCEVGNVPQASVPVVDTCP